MIRDQKNNAILENDRIALNKYKQEKKLMDYIIKIHEDINEIKSLLKEIKKND
jgi:hypothetical protein